MILTKDPKHKILATSKNRFALQSSELKKKIMNKGWNYCLNLLNKVEIIFCFTANKRIKTFKIN